MDSRVKPENDGKIKTTENDNNKRAQNNRNKIMQIGQSMTEMLGVLAIIGVLSVVAVSGYRTAITRHKTNNLIEDVKLAGFLVMEGKFANLPVEEEAFIADFTPKTKYEFLAFKESDTTFGIVATHVEENVCHETLTHKVDWLEEIRANGTDKACHDTDDNNISFFFNTALNDTYTPEDEGTCRADRDCPATKPYCNDGKCQGCQIGQFKAVNGKCYTCGVGVATTVEECHACKNYILNADSLCISCERSTQSIRINTKVLNHAQAQQECAICSNRVYTSSGHPSAEKFCALPCTTEGQFLDADGICKSCNSDSFHIGWNIPNNSDKERYNDLMAKCNNCPNMVKDDSKNVVCVNLDSTRKTFVFTPAHCQQYFKGKRYVAKATWVYECTLCPNKDSSEWEALTDEQREQCTP